MDIPDSTSTFWVSGCLDFEFFLDNIDAQPVDRQPDFATLAARGVAEFGDPAGTVAVGGQVVLLLVCFEMLPFALVNKRFSDKSRLFWSGCNVVVYSLAHNAVICLFST